MAATVTIRTADERDLDAIWRVHAAAIERTCAGHYSDRVIRAWVERLRPESYRGVVRRGAIVIAEHDGTVVGFGQLDLPAGEIQAVYVSPEAQSAGVGGALLAYLEDAALRAGVAVATLKSTLNAEPFYAARGWRATGCAVHKITQQVSLTCVAMEKTLKRPRA